MKKHDNKGLEKIYHEVFGDALQYMDTYELQAVAATYMAIAMRLYKTYTSTLILLLLLCFLM